MAIQKHGKSFFFATTMILGSLHVGNWVSNDSSFHIRHVVVKGNRYLSAETILSEAQVPIGENAFALEVAPIKKRVESLDFVLEAKVARVFPSTIEITVEERQPVALLNDNGLQPIDRKGRLLPRLESDIQLDIPIVSGIRMSKKSQEVELLPDSLRLSAFIDGLYQHKNVLYHQISEFHLSKKNELTVFLLEGGVPVYLGKQRWVEKCDRLLPVLPYLQSDIKKIRAIDLRFDNQVITSS